MSSNGAYSRYTASANSNPYGSTPGYGSYGGGYGSAPAPGYGGASYSAPSYSSSGPTGGGMESTYGQVRIERSSNVWNIHSERLEQ